MTCSVNLWAAILMTASSAAADGQKVIPIPNGGFEQGLEQWRIPSGEGTCSLSTEQAATGKHSLKVVDTHPKRGSDARAQRVPVSGVGVYELRGKVFPVSGSGLGMYVRLLDKNGKLVAAGDTYQRGLGGREKQWRPFSVTVYTTDQTAYLELWIHSYSHARVHAYLDDLHFVQVSSGKPKPPWKGQYKIRPSEASRLTPADVVGPDGIVYPNWTRCGVQGGIPNVKPAARIEQFGARAGDDKDDSAALDRACRAVGEKGGGAVVLGAGVYHLDWPVTVRHDNVVIRGQGADKTKLVFRYAIPAAGVRFFGLEAGDRVGKRTHLEIQAAPTDLMKMSIRVGGKTVYAWERSKHSGNTFARSTRGHRIVGKVPDGPHTLEGVAEYRGGAKKTTRLPIVVDSKFEDTRLVPYSQGAITFLGKGYDGQRVKLTRDSRRGAMSVAVEKTDGLKPGDFVLIDAPATKRWKTLTRNACRWGTYRRYVVRLKAVEGDTLRLEQPLRIEFPTVDGAYVQRVRMIERCGVEDLSIEQTENLWITTVPLRYAVNCWARGVTVKKCGRNPVYGGMAKWCEIRDCTFDDAWFKGGGGTAYSGWEHSWDCLMENVTTYKLRHAPLFQWAAAGNVIRKGTFHLSDGQWHSGWTNENLFEQCVITSERGHGSYGFGMWGSPPEDTAHGPNGPRNVVYNCDVRSQKTGLWMGGMNENWLILHNRFVVDRGWGVFAKSASFDHIIKGNVFVLKDKRSPMVYLATPDCIGVEITGNTLYGGNGKIASGSASALVLKNNVARPLADAPRPTPAVPSIYEWQQTHWRK